MSTMPTPARSTQSPATIRSSANRPAHAAKYGPTASAIPGRCVSSDRRLVVGRRRRLGNVGDDFTELNAWQLRLEPDGGESAGASRTGSRPDAHFAADDCARSRYLPLDHRGYFSQTSRLPELKGAYIYGDYVTGIMHAAWADGAKITKQQMLVDTPATDRRFRSRPTRRRADPRSGRRHFPPRSHPRKESEHRLSKTLSETGLFASTKDHAPAPGVLPYDVIAEPWADGTSAERFIALPGTSQLDLWEKTDVQSA